MSEKKSVQSNNDIDRDQSEDELKEKAKEYISILQKVDEDGILFARRVASEEDSRPRSEGQYQRDYARIMYSSSFRRLQGKMQLLGIKNEKFFRNRLTHSLEVSQIAESIADRLGYDEKDKFVVRAGALAHDIGNAPFGHAGERTLDEIFGEIGGFEGNAQTMRVLTSLELKSTKFKGLNLTYRTLLSVAKYHSKRQHDPKRSKFLYDKDFDLLEKFLQENRLTSSVRTLDVQIVDIADEIAYAAHDLEDGLRQSSFTIDEVLHGFSEYIISNKNGNEKDKELIEKFEDIVKETKKKCEYLESNLDSSQYSRLFNQELTSRLVHELIHDLDFIDVSGDVKTKTRTQQKKELNFKTLGALAHGLKEITFKCINHTKDVRLYEKRGDILLRNLFELYSKNTDLLPPEYRVNKDEQLRKVCDYIAGMMDSYAISEHKKLTGIDFDQINIL